MPKFGFPFNRHPVDGIPGRRNPFSTAPPASTLAVGEYWADGSVSLSPVTGNYTLTTNFDDVGAGDLTTGETSSGTTITEVIVLGSEIGISTWASSRFYRGSCTQTFFYWDGSAWQSMTDTNAGAWPIHNIVYTSDTRTATFSGVAAAAIFRCVSVAGSTTGGNMQTTDSRVA